LLTATCNEWHIENSKNHKKVILFNSTLTVRWCDGEWYHLFYDFCSFRCVTHCMSPLTSV